MLKSCLVNSAGFFLLLFFFLRMYLFIWKNYRGIQREGEGKRQRQTSLIHWFTPQWTQQLRLKQASARSQELLLGPPHGRQVGQSSATFLRPSSGSWTACGKPWTQAPARTWSQRRGWWIYPPPTCWPLGRFSDVYKIINI